MFKRVAERLNESILHYPLRLVEMTINIRIFARIVGRSLQRSLEFTITTGDVFICTLKYVEFA